MCKSGFVIPLFQHWQASDQQFLSHILFHPVLRLPTVHQITSASSFSSSSVYKSCILLVLLLLVYAPAQCNLPPGRGAAFRLSSFTAATGHFHFCGVKAIAALRVGVFFLTPSRFTLPVLSLLHINSPFHVKERWQASLQTKPIKRVSPFSFLMS